MLLCWDFPPNQGIGGRRWGKLAKGLARLGYSVHVIKSAPWPGNPPSPWHKDVQHELIKTYEVKTNTAVRWLHSYTSLWSPVRIRLAQLYLKFIEQGTIYDKAIGAERQIKAHAKDLINKYQIKNFIVTGAPFNLIYYAAKLKNEIPGLHILADFRDPWINSVNYGMNYLNSQRKIKEEEKQRLVFQKVDVITAPNEFLIEQIKSTHGGSAGKLPSFKVLSHFYDPDDFRHTESAAKSGAHFKLVYAGAIYTDSGPYLELLFNAIASFKKNHPGVHVSLDIFSDHVYQQPLEESVRSSVKFNKSIGDRIFDIISRYDAMIILLAHHNKDFKTTKFFEFLPYKLPYLYVGPEGFVSKSIQNDGLGYVLQSPGQLENIYQQINGRGAETGFEDIDRYSLKAVTGNLIQELQ